VRGPKSITRTGYRTAILAASLASLQAADIVTLTNGDRLSGTIQKLEKGKLSFKYVHAGAPLQIDWRSVAAVTSESEFQVTTSDGRKTIAKLGSTFVPVAAVAIQPRPAEEEEAAAPWWRKAWENSSISADFDQNYSGLANYNQFSWSSDIDYTGDRWESSIQNRYYYYGGTDSSSSTYQAYGRMLTRRYLGRDHLFAFSHSFLGRQTTSEGGSGQIHQYGGGLGWTFRRDQNEPVSLYAGVIRSITKGDMRLDDPLYIVAATWNKKLKKKLELTVQVFGYKPMLDGRHFALATDSAAKIPLFGKTYFTIRAYDTPEIGQKQLFSTKNLQVSSGIGIEF